MVWHRQWLWLLFVPLLAACDRYRDDIDYRYRVEYAWQEPGISGEFSLFQGVRWDPSVAQTVRSVVDESLVSQRAVLDLFSGPGVGAVICGHEGADRVLSFAESDVAAACARYNVAAHGQDAVVTVRLLEGQGTPMLAKSERFDVILATLMSDASDTRERHLQVTLQCVADHLNPSGRAFVICQDQPMVDLLKSASEEMKLSMVLPTPTPNPPAGGGPTAGLTSPGTSSPGTSSPGTSSPVTPALGTPSPATQDRPLLPIWELRRPPTPAVTPASPS